MKMYCPITEDICTGSKFSVCPECMDASKEYAIQQAEKALRDLCANAMWAASVQTLNEVPA